MFITAVCVIFLIKLRWPKSKSLKNGLLRPILPRKPRDYTSRDDAIFSGESLLQELSSSWNKLSPENIASSRLVAPEFPRMRPIKRNSNFFSQRERNQLHTVNAYRVPFTCCMLLYQFCLLPCVVFTWLTPEEMESKKNKEKKILIASPHCFIYYLCWGLLSLDSK